MSRLHREDRRCRGAAWIVLRDLALEADGYQCVKCGSRVRLEVDHVTPLQKGGETVLENLQTLCRDCHIEKTARENDRELAPGRREWITFAGASRAKKRRAAQGVT